MEYAYFIGSILVFIVWLLIFGFRRDLRGQMIIISILATPSALFDKLFIPTYWHPVVLFNLIEKVGFSLESVIFSFSLTGVMAVLFELLHNKKEEKTVLNKSRVVIRIVLLAIVFFSLLGILSAVGLSKHLYSEYISAFTVGTIVLLKRADLRKVVLFSTIYGGIFYSLLFLFFNLFFPDFIHNFYNADNLYGVNIVALPIEEILVGFASAFMVSALYEYLFDVRLVNR